MGTCMIRGILALIAALGLAVATPAQDAEPAPEKEPAEKAAEEEIDADLTASDSDLMVRVHEIAEKAHAYLASRQNQDGSFSIDPDSVSASAPIAVTALGCLSFMAGGTTPERGKYKRNLRDGLNYLCKACNQRGEFVDDRDFTSKMHGQGYAILALAQAYGMYGISDRSVDRQRFEEILKKSVALVSEVQTEIGGWYYEAKKTSEHEGSITICIIQSLRAARNSGIHVDREVIDKAVRYIRKSQKKSDGSFRYRLNDDHSSFALTAAAVATLNATGEYDSEAIELAMEYMLKKDPVLNRISPYRDRYPQYARFYSSQAYYQYRDRSRFDRWYPRLVAESVAEQRDDGSFPNPVYGPVYSTAMTTLTLQIPFGYLPIFQR